MTSPRPAISWLRRIKAYLVDKKIQEFDVLEEAEGNTELLIVDADLKEKHDWKMLEGINTVRWAGVSVEYSSRPEDD